MQLKIKIKSSNVKEIINKLQIEDLYTLFLIVENIIN